MKNKYKIISFAYLFSWIIVFLFLGYPEISKFIPKNLLTFSSLSVVILALIFSINIFKYSSTMIKYFRNEEHKKYNNKIDIKISSITILAFIAWVLQVAFQLYISSNFIIIDVLQKFDIKLLFGSASHIWYEVYISSLIFCAILSIALIFLITIVLISIFSERFKIKIQFLTILNMKFLFSYLTIKFKQKISFLRSDNILFVIFEVIYLRIKKWSCNIFILISNIKKKYLITNIKSQIPPASFLF